MPSTRSTMKVIIDTTDVSRKRLRENFNWTKNRTPLQVFFIWALAKGKVRYIVGIYTILLTLSLHYVVKNVNYIFSDFHEKSIIQASRKQQQAQFLPNIVHWSMPDAVKQSLEPNLAKLQWSNKGKIIDTRHFLEEAKDILAPYVAKDDDLRQKLTKLVADVRPDSASIDAIVFENLPLDPYVPPTPTDESVSSLNKSTYVAEAMLMAMGELAGTHVVGYKAETEYSNYWAHEGFPRRGTGGSALTSTAGMLNHHQDMSYQRVIPDLLGLICIREGDDSNLQTTLISIENIIQLLPKHVVSILRQNRFRITASAQWVETGGVEADKVQEKAMLEGMSLHLPVNWDNMIGVDTEASQAIESLRRVVKSAKPLGVHLRSGEMVIFNNKKVVHGRTPYHNLKYDGKSDRVVIRSYFVRQLNAAQMESRII